MKKLIKETIIDKLTKMPTLEEIIEKWLYRELPDYTVKGLADEIRKWYKERKIK